MQVCAGIFMTSLCFLLLVAADAERCPVAVGGARVRPFFMWVAGVVYGVYICEGMIDEYSRSAAHNWVMWGAFAEVFWYFRRI